MICKGEVCQFARISAVKGDTCIRWDGIDLQRPELLHKGETHRFKSVDLNCRNARLGCVSVFFYGDIVCPDLLICEGEIGEFAGVSTVKGDKCIRWDGIDLQRPDLLHQGEVHRFSGSGSDSCNA